MPRTVLHGIDQSAPQFEKLPGRGNQASECYLDDLRSKHVFDQSARTWLPLEYIAFRYDVAEHGGDVGAIELPVTVPADTIILDGIIDILDPFGSEGSATLALSIEAPADVLAATDLTDLDDAGLLDVYPNGSAARAIRVSEDAPVVATVGVAELTAGVLQGYLRCVRSVPVEEGY